MTLKDHGIVLKLLFVQYIININQKKKTKPVELNSHYITDDSLQYCTLSLELGLHKGLLLRIQHEKYINITEKAISKDTTINQ